MHSLLERLVRLSPADRKDVLRRTPRALSAALARDWGVLARPNQLSPWSPRRGAMARRAALEAYDFWLLIAGRGNGKTRSGNEGVHEEAEILGEEYGPAARIGLIARTAADARDTMVEIGDSSILGCARPDFRPRYEPSKRRVTWPNGVIATVFSGDEPELLRGPQFHLLWADELAAWKRPETWDRALDGLRLGRHPRAIVTTTPKRGNRAVKKLLKDPRCYVTRGTTFDNQANLPASFLAAIKERYAGTSLGRQEVYGEELDEVDGALWRLAMIEPHRVDAAPETLARVVVGCDPPGGATECGLSVVGVSTPRHGPAHYHVLEDPSLRASPGEWGARAIQAYRDFKADAVVAESNFGGDMVEHTLRAIDPNVRVKVVHASRGKAVRAEPVVGLYEQGRVHHVGVFAELEAEMTGWVPRETTESPNRLDAMVWAVTELMGSGSTAAPSVGYASRGRESQIRGG